MIWLKIILKELSQSCVILVGSQIWNIFALWFPDASTKELLNVFTNYLEFQISNEVL